MIEDSPENFICLYEQKSNIKLINSSTHPNLFTFINNRLENHINELLNRESIRAGYNHLDSCIIEANSMQEVNQKLQTILDNQHMKESLKDYIIEYLYENQYNVSPNAEAVLKHLKSLIPQELISVSTGFKFSGKTLVGGKIGIKKYLLLYNDKVQQARLILTLIHELSHKKRLLFANENRFWPKTPEEFLGEAGLFIDKVIYGEHVKGAVCNVRKINDEIADSILNIRPLDENQANQIFVTDDYINSRQQLSDNEDDDTEFVCDQYFINQKIRANHSNDIS